VAEFTGQEVVATPICRPNLDPLYREDTALKMGGDEIPGMRRGLDHPSDRPVQWRRSAENLLGMATEDGRELRLKVAICLEI